MDRNCCWIAGAKQSQVSTGVWSSVAFSWLQFTERLLPKACSNAELGMSEFWMCQAARRIQGKVEFCWSHPSNHYNSCKLKLLLAWLLYTRCCHYITGIQEWCWWWDFLWRGTPHPWGRSRCISRGQWLGNRSNDRGDRWRSRSISCRRNTARGCTVFNASEFHQASSQPQSTHVAREKRNFAFVLVQCELKSAQYFVRKINSWYFSPYPVNVDYCSMRFCLPTLRLLATYPQFAIRHQEVLMRQRSKTP